MRFQTLAVLLCVYLATAPAWGEPPSHATELAKQATAWIAKDQSKLISHIHVRPPDRRAIIAPCRQPIRFKWPFDANNRTLEASCSEPDWRYFLQIRYIPGTRIWAASRDLAAGHLIEFDDLLAITTTDNRDRHFDDLDDLVGKTLNQDIRRGEPISQSQIQYVSKQFQTQKRYRAGEPIQREDLLILSDSPADQEVLSVWPLGLLVSSRSLPSGHTLTPSDIIPAQRVVVATTNIIRNQVVTSEMLAMKVLPAKDLNQSSLTQLNAAIGLEATRTIQAGAVISVADLKPADLIRKGERVTLTIRRGALTLKVETTALENAKLGEQVRLLNSDSGTEIHGVVTGRHQAEGR